MDISTNTIQIVLAICSSVGLFFTAIIHWDKIRPVLFSHASCVVLEYALIFTCVHIGPLAVLIGAHVYIMTVFFDFLRRNDTSCLSVGSAIFASALGTICFATQFTILLTGK